MVLAKWRVQGKLDRVYAMRATNDIICNILIACAMNMNHESISIPNEATCVPMRAQSMPLTHLLLLPFLSWVSLDHAGLLKPSN